MREWWVRILAGLTGALVLLLALAFAWRHGPREPAAAVAAAAAMPPPPQALVEAGRAVYDAQGCAMCHAIAGEGNPRLPLDGVGGRRSDQALRDWILATGTAEAQLAARAVRMKSAYRDLGDAELDALVAYMRSLGSAP